VPELDVVKALRYITLKGLCLVRGTSTDSTWRQNSPFPTANTLLWQCVYDNVAIWHRWCERMPPHASFSLLDCCKLLWPPDSCLSLRGTTADYQQILLTDMRFTICCRLHSPLADVATPNLYRSAKHWRPVQKWFTRGHLWCGRLKPQISHTETRTSELHLSCSDLRR